MAGNRLEKINKELQKGFAEFIERESNAQSLVTVTRSLISPDLHTVTVYISVFPADHEQNVLDFLNRRKWDARDFIKKRVVTRVVPMVQFVIDYGEKNRQHVDQLLREES